MSFPTTQCNYSCWGLNSKSKLHCSINQFTSFKIYLMGHPIVTNTISLEELLIIIKNVPFGYNFLVQQAVQSTNTRLKSNFPLDNLEIRLHHTSQHSSLLPLRSTDKNKRIHIMSFLLHHCSWGPTCLLKNPNHHKMLSYKL